MNELDGGILICIGGKELALVGIIHEHRHDSRGGGNGPQTRMSIRAGLRLRQQSTAAAVAYTCGNTGHLDIAPLEEYRSSMKGSHTNLASVDKRLDMMRTHQVMALLADHRDCFCCCYPIAVHSNSSSPGTTFKFHRLMRGG